MTTRKAANVESAREVVRALLSLVKLASEPGRGRDAFRIDAMFWAADSNVDSRAAMTVAQAAEAGDPDAMHAVHQAIAWHVGQGQPVPEILRPYLFELLLLKPPTRKQKRGRHHQNYLRDDLIRLAVKAAEGYGFSRTRNEATEAPSACSIVSEELAANGVKMGEENVADIVRGRR
jgi:hypothetical protein